MIAYAAACMGIHPAGGLLLQLKLFLAFASGDAGQ